MSPSHSHGKQISFSFFFSFLAYLLFYLSPDSILQIPESKICYATGHTVRTKASALCKTKAHTHVAGETVDIGPLPTLSDYWQDCTRPVQGNRLLGFLKNCRGGALMTLVTYPSLISSLAKDFLLHITHVETKAHFLFSVLSGDSAQLASIL